MPFLSKEENAAVIIQRAFRASKHPNFLSRAFDDASLRQFLGDDLYERATNLSVVANPAVPQKCFNINQERLTEWVSSHPDNVRPIAFLAQKYIKHVSFGKFLHRLQITVNAFNKKLAALPESNRGYFIILGQAHMASSNAWILSWALRFLSHAPLAIIPASRQHWIANANNFFKEMFQTHPAVKSMLYLDDAFYSGIQAAETIETIFSDGNGRADTQLLSWMNKQDVTLYLGAPYISHQQDTYALLKAGGLYNSELSLAISIKFLPHVPMLSLVANLTKSEQLSYEHCKAHVGYGFEKMCRQKGITFFDHKIADVFSVPAWMLYGNHLDTGHSDNEPISFITEGCKPY